MERKGPIEVSNFVACDLRIGTIQSATLLEGARRPAYVLHIDFGALGILKSTAQLVQDYTPTALVGRQVAAVVNLPPKQVGGHQSRCLVLGAVQGEHVALLEVGSQVPPGTPIA